ncbi:MAG: 1,4-dihydroxy-2-naphthoate octaprenyltransferase [Parachlamydiaceae bacterium]|nr:1,4-dihydroxy-2-naphthoate octaprenyltransferase [Parachlamydiaceae bacterium]
MTFRAWMMALRLRTLPIPTIQVLTGTALGYSFTGHINITIALFTWLVAVFITFGTNLINDVFDFEKGGDSLNRVGHLKVITAGYLSKAQVHRGGLILFALAIFCSIPLIIHSSWWMLPIVLISVACGYCYTGGPYPICYIGLSEVFIFIFYGGVCVISSFYVQAGFISGASILLAVQMGMLAILSSALNNLRDIFEDADVQKLTLAVRFGSFFARCEILFMAIVPFILNFGWFLLGYHKAALMPLILLPLALFFVYGVWLSERGAILNRYFALGVLIHFLFGFLLIIGLLNQ